MLKIKKKIKHDDFIKIKDPVIFNFDEVPFWYYKKP